MEQGGVDLASTLFSWPEEGATGSASEDPNASVTIAETGTIVTPYSNTAESVAPNGTKVILQSRALWAKFNKTSTEMRMTIDGRRMFPVIEVTVAGLEPDDSYAVFMDIIQVGQYKYKYRDSEMVMSGMAEPMGSRNETLYMHPTGSVCENQLVSFKECKLTTNPSDQLRHGSRFFVVPGHKYQPRIQIWKTNCDLQKRSNNFSTHIFPETQFVAVTTAHDQRIRQLKVEYNPIAAGCFHAMHSARETEHSRFSSTSGPPPFDQLQPSGFGLTGSGYMYQPHTIAYRPVAASQLTLTNLSTSEATTSASGCLTHFSHSASPFPYVATQQSSGQHSSAASFPPRALAE